VRIISISPRSDKVKLVLLFFLSHIFILFNRSIGWDGYGLLYGTKENIVNDFKHYGLTEVFGLLHYNMIHLSDHPIFVYNCAVIITSFIATWLSYLIIKKIKFFSESETFNISLIIATLPFVYFSLIGFPAILCYDIFLFAVFSLVRYKETKLISWRILSLVFFYLSFYYNSHISFYLIALILLWYYFPKPFKLKRFILTNPDFILLTLVFVLHQKLIATAYNGPRDTSYNAINADAILGLPKYLVYSLEKSFFRLFEICFYLLTETFYFFLLLITLPVVYLILKKDWNGISEKTIRLFKGRTMNRSYFLLILGLFLFLLGAFPFSLASKHPAFYDRGAADMHQCNLYIGAAITIYALVTIFINASLQKFVLIVLISCFIVANIKNVLLQNQQWLKEEAILTNMRDNPVIRDNRTFLVDDQVEELNSSFRLQLATLNGLMRRAFNNEQTRFAITRGELENFLGKRRNDSLVFDNPNEQFSMKDYKTANFDYNLVIDKGEVTLTTPLTLKLMAYSLLNRSRFENEVKTIISLKLLPCSDCTVLIP
jgi:hypothetical protein